MKITRGPLCLALVLSRLRFQHVSRKELFFNKLLKYSSLDVI